MEKRRLGATNFLVNPIGLGCMGFSHAYGAAIEKSAAIKTIREAYELGYNFFDTAECYTGENIDGSISNNEELVGAALKDVSDKVVIATKFGVAHNSDRSLRLDSSPATIRKSVDGSLKRLGVETIDLYYQHRIDPKIEPEIVAEVMSKLIKAGKIRAWGISEANEEYLRRAHKICPATAIQNRYSLMARWHEKLLPVLEELGITFVAFSPLKRILLPRRFPWLGCFAKNHTSYRYQAVENSRGSKKISEREKFSYRRTKSQTLTLNSTRWTLKFSAALRLRNKIFSSGRPLPKFHKGGGRLFYFAIGNIPSDSSVGKRIGRATDSQRAQKIFADSCRRIFLQEKSGDNQRLRPNLLRDLKILS